LRTTDLMLRLMLQARWTIFVARQVYQRGIFAMVLKAYITIRWDTESWSGAPETDAKSILYLRLVITNN